MRRAWIVLTLSVLLTACGAPPATAPVAPAVATALPSPELAYEVGECRQDIPAAKLTSWAGVEIATHDGAIHIEQRINYVCCAEIEVELQVEEQNVRIVETNVGQVCRCMCGYDLQAEVTGLPAGEYRVEVWGVQYKEVHPLERLGQATVTLP
jgi:hypothetical protein